MGKQKTLQDLNVIDNFMFNELTMQKDKEKAALFCRTILEPIIGCKIGKLKVIPQKVEQGISPGHHGIQMDAYIEAYTDENGQLMQDVKVRLEPAIYNIEPNTYYLSGDEIIHRARYYHATIDRRILPKGEEYKKLKQAVVIFIFPYDPFGYDSMVYTVKRRCMEIPEMVYDDGDITYYLYAHGTKNIPSEELRDVLNFMVESTDENAKTEGLRAVKRMMNDIKQDGEKEAKYMLTVVRDYDLREEGREEAVLEIIKKKLAKGKNIPTIADEIEYTEEDIKSLLSKHKIPFTFGNT